MSVRGSEWLQHFFCALCPIRRCVTVVWRAGLINETEFEAKRQQLLESAPSLLPPPPQPTAMTLEPRPGKFCCDSCAFATDSAAGIASHKKTHALLLTSASQPPGPPGDDGPRDPYSDPEPEPNATPPSQQLPPPLWLPGDGSSAGRVVPDAEPAGAAHLSPKPEKGATPAPAPPPDCCSRAQPGSAREGADATAAPPRSQRTAAEATAALGSAAPTPTARRRACCATWRGARRCPRGGPKMCCWTPRRSRSSRSSARPASRRAQAVAGAQAMAGAQAVTGAQAVAGAQATID